MIKYFIYDGEQELGPFNIEELKSKNLQNDTKIWHEGLDNWINAGEIEALKQLISSNTKPPPLNTAMNLPHQNPAEINQRETTHIVKPERKKSNILTFVILGVVVIASIIGWTFYQNTQNADTIHSLEEKIDTQNNEKNLAEQERQRINEENTQKNMNFRNNWQNYIKLSNSEPEIDYTFGGIGSFAVNVNNGTTHMLDQVDVAVEYIRKNGDSYQTKIISLFNIPAGAIETGTAPSSINGVRVNCTIIKIVSKKMHFCYPEDNGNPEDPYFCKSE